MKYLIPLILLSSCAQPDKRKEYYLVTKAFMDSSNKYNRLYHDTHNPLYYGKQKFYFDSAVFYMDSIKFYKP